MDAMETNSQLTSLDLAHNLIGQAEVLNSVMPGMGRIVLTHPLLTSSAHTLCSHILAAHP